ncbi:sigma-54-dependent Fis family transcriptional regulator [Noviherbaspirillum saxi]|uniref:Sigma-54-dependent Fis family transcriptional regulator n=1 Tax=Noviherbaspirillum saxi TaxID=2320863 RepID=A0A3A3FI15_9BURK|nr:sigma-54-dependent Fis family transcriptional regulator [Noviherbaspirillum saxi]
MQQADEVSSDYKVVLIEDDDLLRHSLKQALSGAGFETFAFEQSDLALEQLPSIQPDVVLTDLYLSDKDTLDGLKVIERIREVDPELPTVLMTARGSIPIAIDATRKGAYDFLEKPFDKNHLITVIRRAAAQRRLTVENRNLLQRLTFAAGIERILIGQSAAMQALRNLILRIAPAPANVIILGETGSGKEMVARCVHEFSGRQGNFVPINCAAIPETLFESELFGHEAGAYTGAAKQRIGKIEYASGGTLFLDEIEAMPLHLQAKLLRVLQERQVERLGQNKALPVDLRVVAATKVDLKDHSAQDKFRIDLYYRLNVATLKIPPLRERREDLTQLFAHFLHEAALRFGQPPAIPDREIQQQLLTYDWPGNVRELRNVAEQFQLGIPVSIGQAEAPVAPQSLDEIIAAVEKAVIAETLKRHDGAATNACNELKINYSTLYRKMKLYDMDLSDYKKPAEQ